MFSFACGSLTMTINNHSSDTYTLAELGFSSYFRSQLSLDDLEHLQPMRIVEVQRDLLHALGENGHTELIPSGSELTGYFCCR